MLDKDLCRILQIDPFLEWIQNMLDDLEDALYSGVLEGNDKLQVKAKYNALIEARDTYCQLKKRNH